MPKYINADALLNHLYSHQDEQPDIAKVIAEFDAADVVEVVRCGQCKFFQSSGCFIGIQREQISSDNYCAWGQSKYG